jgi:hypothetical protein
MSVFSSSGQSALITLIYELLDAHQDTVRLADADACAMEWQAHLDYLRALQRAGREVLAANAAPYTASQSANVGPDDGG